MVFQLSPGVLTQEYDLTTIVPAVGTTEGAFAGQFVWGPIEQIITIADEIQLRDTFGKPDANTFVPFMTAANFLAYGNNLKVVRASANANLYNATANSQNLLIKNRLDYDENRSGGANTYGMWAAKYAGDLGNSLKVSMYGSSNTVAFSNWVYSSYFDGPPGTSTFVSNQGGTNDELHIVVVDEDGKFTGVANTVLERFPFVSKASDAKKDDGSSNYYKNVINEQSKYIWWLCHPDSGIGMANATNWGSVASATFGQASNTVYTVSLTNATYAQPANSNLITAFQKFKNPEAVDIALIITGDSNVTVVTDIINNIVEYRKDCVAFLSPRRADVVNQDGSETTNVTGYRDTLPSTSYAVMDSGWKYQYDKYNDVFRWVPLNGDIAGLCVRTDFERDPWYSPAGYNRGQIKNVLKLSWNPNKTQRDELYKKGINPVISTLGEGTLLFGDKTMLSKPSAFDRINVRRLFIVLEKAIARASKYSLFEFNDAFTRSQFVSLVEPYLRNIQGRRGIYDYRVVCDETNNTPEVIDRDEFIGDIYIKPARSINFIQLNFVAVRTGVSFDEVVGKF